MLAVILMSYNIYIFKKNLEYSEKLVLPGILFLLFYLQFCGEIPFYYYE